jgi:hypothetical protein
MDALFASLCPSGGACDLFGTWIAALLTFLVFSYLFNGMFGRTLDLPFRIASCLLVGTAIGFVGAVVLRTSLVPLLQRLVDDAVTLPDSLGVFVIDLLPALLGASLLFKLAPTVRGSSFSNFGMAYLFGIGAALAIGGALSGALVPQLQATMLSLAPQGDDLGWVNNVLLVVGTLGAFLAFRFIQPGNRPYQRVYDLITGSWGTIGRAFIMIAFGALLASLITARVSALVGQLYFILHDVFPIVP